MTTDDRNPVTLAHEVLDTDQYLATIPRTAPVARTQMMISLSEAAPALAQSVIDMDNALKSGEASDGYHTHNELYEYRTLYHAHAAMAWALDGVEVTKSWNHSDGEPCFGGGWFIVTAQLPTGQVSNHYPAEDWPLFHMPEVERPAEWDGHTPQEASARIRAALTGYTDG